MTRRSRASTGQPKGSASAVLFLLFVLGLVLMPLPLGSNRPWAWGGALFYFSALMVLTLGFCGSSLLSCRKDLVRLLVPAIALMLWLLWLASYLLPAACPEAALQAEPAAACVRAVDLDAHVLVLLKSGLYAEVLLLSLVLVDRLRRAYALVACLVGAGAIWGTLAVLGALSGMGFESEWVRLGGGHRATGPFVNPNHFAGYLEMLLGLGIGGMIGLMKDPPPGRLWRQVVRDWVNVLLSPKAMLRIALVILVVALVTSQSRSGNIAFMVAMLCGCALAAGLMQRRRPRGLLWLAGSLLIIDVVVISSWFGLDRLAERVGTKAVAAVESEQQGEGYYIGADRERALVARITMRMWDEAKWTGHGGGGFRVLYPAARTPEVTARFYDHAHNDYAQMLAEFGIIGSVLAGSLVLAAMTAAIVALHRRHRREIKGLAAGVIIAMWALLIHTWSDFNLQIPANAALFALLMGLGWQCCFGFPATASDKTPQRRTQRRSGIVMGLPVVLVALWSGPGQADLLARRCSGVLTPESGAIPDPGIPDLAALRRRLQAQPRDESLRVQAARIAVDLALRSLRLEATGQAAAAESMQLGIKRFLADTVWRVRQSARAGNIESALALRVLARLKLADAESTAMACKLLATAVSEDRVVNYERALCLSSSRPAEALAAMQQAGVANHVKASEAMAQLCMRAQTPDPACAIDWLCRAAAAGSATGAAAAAFILMQEPVADIGLALSLYERAARAGDATSANNLGEFHERGIGGQVDYRLAESWYQRAADAGLPEGQLNLARLWLERDFENPLARRGAIELLGRLAQRHPLEVGTLRQRFGL